MEGRGGDEDDGEIPFRDFHFGPVRPCRRFHQDATRASVQLRGSVPGRRLKRIGVVHQRYGVWSERPGAAVYSFYGADYARGFGKSIGDFHGGGPQFSSESCSHCGRPGLTNPRLSAHLNPA